MKKIILAVDDQYDMLRILSEYIKSCGYMPLAFVDWLEARETYKQVWPDVALVIVDVMLGERMSGEIFSDLIRAINPKQPILHISGYLKPDDMRVDEFLYKPFVFDDFQRAVKTAICVIDIGEQSKGG